MNGKLFFAAVVFGAFLIGFSGVSDAGGWMHKSQGAGVEEMKAAERAEGPGVVDSGSWQYFEAVETGNVPTPAGTEVSEPRNIPPVLWTQPHVTHEYGGLEFRQIDLGP